MSRLDELLSHISNLQPDEQDQLARWLLAHGHPVSWYPRMTGIDTEANVCGGEPRIIRTRIPVWVLERMRQLGLPEAEILRSYPTLRAEDLVNAWAYVDAHRADIDEQIRLNEEA